MNCHDLVELLIDFLAEDLPAEQVEHIRQHLAGCPPCVYYVQTYQLTIQLTRSLPSEPPPPALLERLREAARQDDQR